MTGTYIMEAIPPYCKEVRTPVSVVEWRGDRVLLRGCERHRFDGYETQD
jgi:hypothetical protein